MLVRHELFTHVVIPEEQDMSETKRYEILSGKRGGREVKDGPVVIRRPGDVIELTHEQARLWPGKLRLQETEEGAIVGVQANEDDDSVGLGSAQGQRDLAEQREQEEAHRTRRAPAHKETRKEGGTRARRS